VGISLFCLFPTLAILSH